MARIFGKKNETFAALADMNEEDFLREVRTLVNLRHPHLITVHGICTRFQPYKIVMEYMQHGSLKSFLQSFFFIFFDFFMKNKIFIDHRLDLEKSVLIYMAIQIADGMEYIERQKHCHRDLRADNVLVGEHNQCKISDFGLARHLVVSRGCRDLPLLKKFQTTFQNDMYEIKQLELPVRWTAPEAIHTKRYTIKCDGTFAPKGATGRQREN